MEDKNQRRDSFMPTSSHMMILLVYTIFSIVLTGESILLSWEKWAIPLIFSALVGAWVLHISQQLPKHLRLWVYSILMMVTFFFYGIHDTSVFDLAPVMVFVIMIFSMTGTVGLVNLAMVTYYVTILYNIFSDFGREAQWDRLLITRTLLHLILVFMAGYAARRIMKNWKKDRKSMMAQVIGLIEITDRTDDFLNNVSHELRTPINAVLGLTEVMLKKEKNPEIKQDMTSVKNAGQQVERLLGDILDFTEIDEKNLKINRENYKITSIVEDLLKEYRMEKESTCELIFDLDAKTPAVMVGDGMKIKKMLRHLISNGLKFTQKGCVYVRVFALEKPYGVNLCLEVSDTGKGMSEDVMEKAYEKFYQDNSDGERWSSGMGMGLTIVNGFVKAMGGFISMESEEEIGTTVRISIPQGIASAEPCMSVSHNKELCIATYLRFDHYDSPKIQEYYNETISNLLAGLSLKVHRANQFAELKKLSDNYDLTHVFIGEDEYRSNQEYMETLAKSVEVAVVAGRDFEPKKNSGIKIFRKPLSSFLVVRILNSLYAEDETEHEENRMCCPGLQVLVVDDEPMNLLVAEEIFRDYQMEVDTAGSGKQALGLCGLKKYDLIFMDHMMPEMDGVETMKELRKREFAAGERSCIIALTANAVSSGKDMLLSEDFDGFLSKPIEIAELEGTLKKVLPVASIVYQRSAGHDGTDAQRGESAKKTAESQAFFAVLSECGIDGAIGLKYCRNDQEFYQMLLKKFAEDFAVKGDELRLDFAKKDWKNYAIRVHALKSTSKMIGAMRLSEVARELELAAKEKKEKEISSNHDRMLSMYSVVATGILDGLGREEHLPENEILEISEEKLIKELQELEECLKTYEAERAGVKLQKLSEFQYGEVPLEDKLSAVKEGIENYDMEPALRQVQIFLAELLGGKENES